MQGEFLNFLLYGSTFVPGPNFSQPSEIHNSGEGYKSNNFPLQISPVQTSHDGGGGDGGQNGQLFVSECGRHFGSQNQLFVPDSTFSVKEYTFSLRIWIEAISASRIKFSCRNPLFQHIFLR